MAQRRVAAKTILLRQGGMDMARSKFLALMVIDSHYTGLRI